MWKITLWNNQTYYGEKKGLKKQFGGFRNSVMEWVAISFSKIRKIELYMENNFME